MKTKSARGFTLIEILIALGLLGIIFTGLSFSNFRDYARKQGLNNAYSAAMVELRSAAKDAASGVKPAGCNGILNGYKIDVSGSRYGFTSYYQGYSISASCGAASSVTVKQVALPTGLWVFINPSFTFKSLGYGTSIPTNVTGVMSIWDQSSNLYSPQIQIMSTGDIK